MNKVLRPIIGLLVCFLGFSSLAKDDESKSQETFVYVADIPGGRAEESMKFVHTVDDSYAQLGFNGTYTYGGDSISGYKLCPESYSVFCIFGEYVFAVPRKLRADQDSWEYYGYKFTVVRRDVTVKIFGRELKNIIVIRTPPCAELEGRLSGKGYLSLYSLEYGVIGITREKDTATGKPSPVYWLAGQYGLAPQ